MDATEVPPLPPAKPVTISDRITIQAPLSRRGIGPGLLILVDDDTALLPSDRTLDPPPLNKWAEEGFAVAQILIFGGPEPSDLITNGLQELGRLDECDASSGFGLISYGPDPTPLLQQLCSETRNQIKATVTYDIPITITTSTDFNIPGLSHYGIKNLGPIPKSSSIPIIKHFTYPSALPQFVLPSHTNYNPSSAALSHTRTLSFLKPLLHGPYFDLEAIWEEHTLFEFGERSVEKTMATMVAEPYVNHIPTLTGGIGRDRLTNFYRHHFIFSNPVDTALELVSRTVGIDRVIDEFVFACTHDRVVDWLLPNVPPTGKSLRIPFTSIVNVRGDRLYHEHIAWDQATVLVQLGLLPEYLPFPYPIDGKTLASGKRFEVKVPAAGYEVAAKLVDESAVKSNRMLDGDGVREVDDV